MNHRDPLFDGPIDNTTPSCFVDKGGEGGGDYVLVIFHDPGLCHIISEPVTGLDEGTHNIKGGDLLKVPPPSEAVPPSSPEGEGGVGVGVPRESMETVGSLDEE